MTVSEGFKIDSEEAGGLALARRPLLWLNCLCLDAPLVAVAWQGVFAKAFHSPRTTVECLALFLTAWWIYLADRFADSFTLTPSNPAAARVIFSLRHRRLFAFALITICLADSVLILANLNWTMIRDGTVVGLAALFYLFLNNRFPRLWQCLPVKELSVGFLFALGTTIIFLNKSVSPTLFFAVFLFGCVCSLNCLSIAFWERSLDLGQGKDSYATIHRGHMWLVRAGCLVMAMLAGALSGRAVPPLLAAALATSSALLLLLHFINVGRDERTALADMALLLPALFFLLPGLW